MSEALRTLRLPYWDAAAVPPIGERSYPWCVQRKTIEVEVPNGDSSMKTLIPNPLYTYIFHPLPVEAFRSILANLSSSLHDANTIRAVNVDQWIQWMSTKRFLTSNNATAESQDSKIASQLDANSDNLRQRTYQMLAMQKDYYNISNNMVHNKNPLHGVVLDSLKSIHDTLHNTVGGGSGHTWQSQYSAFDPIFSLLHA
jgi:tyrosinase